MYSSLDYDKYAGITIEDIFGEDEDYRRQQELEKERADDIWAEKLAFGFDPKCGFNAHAYKKELDNLTMVELRRKGYTFEKIAKQLGCSKSTVRNRLKKMGTV